MTSEDIAAAKRFAEEAASVAAKLESGTWESVQALALTSIAHSLAALTDRRSVDG